MGFIARRLIKQNLNLLDVLVEDTNNTFFNVVEVPTTFTQGRSSFKIFGSQFLKQDVPLKMEMLDVLGNTEPDWTDPIGFGDRGVGITGVIGVYRVIYKPTMETKYLGEGVVGHRRTAHKTVYLNKGAIIHKKSGGVTDSHCGRKMYAYDSKLDNWLFSWCHIGNDELSKEYETQLQHLEDPPYSEKYMAGK